jgi:general secretion pathway protein M
MSRFPSSRIVWIQILTVLAFLLALTAAALYVVARYDNMQKHMANLEPRYARLLGMAQKQTDFQTEGQLALDRLKRLAYPASQDATQAGNDAQQRIRALFADSKLDIASIQVLPSKDEGAFDRIPIDLRVEGDLTGIQNALALLTAQTPAVFSEEVTLQTVGAVKPASMQRLSGQFVLSVFRMRP